MRSTRFVLAAAPLAAIALTTAAEAQDFKEGEVVLKSGRKLVGKIDDRGDKVIVIVKGVGETELQKDDVDKIIYKKTDDDDSGSARKKRQWLKVTCADGRVVKGDAHEDGDDLVITTKIGKTKATTRVAKSQIVRQEYVPAEDDDEEGGAETAADLERFVDYEAHFVLERPGKDWKVLKKSLSPRIRAQMNHAEKDAFVSVSIRPSQTPYGEPTKDSAKRVGVDADAELKGEFERVSQVRCELGELFATKVWELRYSGVAAGEKTEYEFLEDRFERNGFVYAVTAAAERRIFPELQPTLKRALESFSFISSHDLAANGYADLATGFGIEAPLGWTTSARPFDEKMPLELKNADGRAFVKVHLTDAPTGKTSKEATDEWLAARKAQAKLTVEPTQKTVDRSGAKIETFVFKGFEAGGGRIYSYSGAAAVVGPKLILALGVSPDTDEDAAKLQGEVQAAIDRFQILDPNAIQDKLRRGNDAARACAEGYALMKNRNPSQAVTKLTDAIGLFDGYARAYYLRALAHEDLKKWKELRDDLEAALRLDPRSEYQSAMARSFYQEAGDLAKEKKYPEAETIYRRAMKADPQNDKIKGDLVGLYKAWWNELKKNWSEAGRFLEHLEASSSEREKAIAGFMVDAYCELGDSILHSDKHKHSTAEGYARKALRIDKGNSRANSLLGQCIEAGKQIERDQSKGKR